MSLSKLTFFPRLKTLTKPFHHHPPSSFSLRFLSFTTSEELAAEQRRQKRLRRIEPPPNSLRPSQSLPQPQPRPQTPIQIPNPDAPKLPEHISALTGKRLELHNRILTLIKENDLNEASLLTRHSIYSNCRPTIFTCNSVMAALLRQSRFSDFLLLHRFVIQSGIVPNVVTHNLLISAYCDCKKTDTALEHYKVLFNDSLFRPSLATYRILVKGLVDNCRVEQGLELKNEMFEKGLSADPVVYNYLMLGLVNKGDSDGALAVFDELKEKLGFVSDGIVYGNLMKAYFLKGMEKEAMEYYADAVGENSNIKMRAEAYNSVLQALIKNEKFDEVSKLFDRMMGEHNPPMKLTVDVGSFNVMADGFCEQGRFKEAIEVFRKMGEKRCSPDTSSYNNLIKNLCSGGMLAEAEDLYQEMGNGADPDECTYFLLIDSCFGQNRPEDALGYFEKMVETGLKPNLNGYNKVVESLIKAGKIDDANAVFSQMIEKLKLEASNYEVILRALCDTNKLDEVLKLVREMLKDEKVGLSPEMDEVVRDALRKEGREEDLVRMLEEKEREDIEKAEALARKAEADKAAALAAKAKASIGISWLTGFRTANASVASAETTSVIGDTAIGNQEGSGETVSVDADPKTSDDSLEKEPTPSAHPWNR